MSESSAIPLNDPQIVIGRHTAFREGVVVVCDGGGRIGLGVSTMTEVRETASLSLNSS